MMALSSKCYRCGSEWISNRTALTVQWPAGLVTDEPLCVECEKYLGEKGPQGAFGGIGLVELSQTEEVK